MIKEQVNAVAKMQYFIRMNIGAKVTDSDIAKAAGYSVRHCKRLFKAITGKSITEYIRLIRLTDAARDVASGEDNILDIALNHQYESHEGFTKAFASVFGITPSRYRKGDTAIPYFIPYSVDHYYLYMNGERMMCHEEKTARICTVTIIEKSERKLIFLPSKTSRDYWSYCIENGCEWEGLLNSIPGKLDQAAILTLPESIIPLGFTNCAAGIEVPEDYTVSVPNGYITAELRACRMIYFQSEPFENEDDFESAISEVFKAYEKYDPSPYGYIYDYTIAPCFNYGAQADKGAKIAFPVKPLP